MLIVLKKQYTIEVTVREGDDAFWNTLRGKSGADDVVNRVRAMLVGGGFDSNAISVRLTNFRETA